MDIVLLKDYTIHTKGNLLKNIEYSVCMKLIRENIARKATLSDLAVGEKKETQKVGKPKAKKTQAKK